MTYEEAQKLKPGDMIDVTDSLGRVHREIVQSVDDTYIKTIASAREQPYDAVVIKTVPKWQIYQFIEKVNIQWD